MILITFEQVNGLERVWSHQKQTSILYNTIVKQLHITTLNA